MIQSKLAPIEVQRQLPTTEMEEDLDIDDAPQAIMDGKNEEKGNKHHSEEPGVLYSCATFTSILT